VGFFVDYILPFDKKRSAKNIWDEDKIRVDKIKEYGYNLEVIWESELKEGYTLLNKIIKKYERKN
jgi:G:T-mismatch repair DNA endonuclease (very short patch repair protein)